MRVTVIRTDGSTEFHDVMKKQAIKEICALIHAETLDSVNLRDGSVMMVNDRGWETKTLDKGNGNIELVPQKNLLPVNHEATQLYHRICLPGTTHKIVGDVAIALDEDFA